MPDDDNELDSKVLARLNTRESSTLTFATVTASSSLVVLALSGVTAFFSLDLSLSRSSSGKYWDLFRRRTKNIRLSRVIDERLRATPRVVVGAAKAISKATLLMVGLLIGDHLLEFTTSPYYIPASIAIAGPIVFGIKRSKGFARNVKTGGTWLIAAMAAILGKIPENLVPLHPSLSVDTVMSLVAILILLLPVAWLLNFGDWFKSSATDVRQKE
jgi:hypothetical protein